MKPVMAFRGVVAFFVLALMVLPLLPALGCGGSHTTTQEERLENEEVPAQEEKEVSSNKVTGGGKTTVHMCGRSVLAGWFEHWGWDYDPQNPVEIDGHTLIYHEMESPPEITDTAVAVARAMGAQGGGIMFFKLCFADFTGGDEQSARENLAANQEIIREVTKVAVNQQGLTLILGNALPMVKQYTDDWLVWNHRRYNGFLEDLAAAYKGRVLVLDLYGALASPEGWLRPEYAADTEDSHLNGNAYAALDAVLRQLLVALPPAP